ncbi:HAD family phosphatase [Streptomyces sp. TRM76323]|uniref:HAD family phosphatase n=1 Tax=Streptomyces tamarix TaxID=3078565 RepID=A0ABU3QSU6_9ACTN|nr:HAD family phosphatase [Streptomyces tamarix]MDT9685447.1 HAD family phosphatase [Streptomyces tamarix]
MSLHRILSWTPAAVVFDCDGTLMDTERHWVDARQRACDDVGLRLTAGFAERAKGLHYTECGQLMADEGGRPELGRDLAQRLLHHFLALVSDHPVTMPGARELVEATAAFAPLAVASNCPREVVESCLGTAGLLPHFRAVVVPDGTARPKPHPDLYRTAARHCGADPADTLAVEDTHCGILAATRAGMRVLGVGPWPGEETIALTDLWVEALDDPRISGWAAERAPLRTATSLPASASPPDEAVLPAPTR